jgi:hypothetical protein
MLTKRGIAYPDPIDDQVKLASVIRSQIEGRDDATVIRAYERASIAATSAPEVAIVAGQALGAP